ncbi:MAG TPA: type II secretion system F family protein [Acidimicrobiia bacterium]|nr:type II secretion system F family protein [Acidimicrobiia bacterium]
MSAVIAAIATAIAVGAAVAGAHGIDTAIGMRRRVRPRRRIDRATWLRQAGVAIAPAQFAAGSALLALGAGGLVAMVTGSVYVAAAPALAASVVPHLVLGRRRAERMRDVQRAWPDGLRDLLASIAAGRSLSQAIHALAETGPVPLQRAFARFAERSRMFGTAAALEVIREELADPASDRVIEVLVLAHERGGNVVRTILEDLVDAATRDLKLADQIETEGLEMQINARAVVVLPWIVLVVLTARPGPFRDFYRGSAGLLTLALGALMSAIGVIVLTRLGRVPREPRVFGGGGGGAR